MKTAQAPADLKASNPKSAPPAPAEPTPVADEEFLVSVFAWD